MTALHKEIIALVDKLERADPIEGSTWQITINHLKGLMAAAENAEDNSEIAARFDDLEQFWASSVAWCSELSKDIEKVIILYKEQI